MIDLSPSPPKFEETLMVVIEQEVLEIAGIVAAIIRYIKVVSRGHIWPLWRISGAIIYIQEGLRRNAERINQSIKTIRSIRNSDCNRAYRTVQ